MFLIPKYKFWTNTYQQLLELPTASISEGRIREIKGVTENEVTCKYTTPNSPGINWRASDANLKTSNVNKGFDQPKSTPTWLDPRQSIKKLEQFSPCEFLMWNKTPMQNRARDWRELTRSRVKIEQDMDSETKEREEQEKHWGENRARRKLQKSNYYNLAHHVNITKMGFC